MVAFLSVVAVALAILNMLQYRLRKKRNASLKYLAEKLAKVLEQGTAEQLLLFMADQEVRNVLIAINQLLEDKQKTIVQYTKTQRSMKKMLTNISHDLKTPLTVVLGYIETIQHDPHMDAEERNRLLGKVQAKTYEIVELIHTFFDLAKLESGDKEIPLTRIQMNEVCKDNILQFYEMVQARGVKAVIDIPEQPIFALGNGEALDRVLNNLLSNALQYGAEGKIIGLSLSTDENSVYVEVWDQGQGIKEQDQELVFERMYTLEDSRNKSFQGSGLGLTISKRLVEVMGGEISLYSEPFVKTAFTIKLKRISY